MLGKYQLNFLDKRVKNGGLEEMYRENKFLRKGKF